MSRPVVSLRPTSRRLRLGVGVLSLLLVHVAGHLALVEAAAPRVLADGERPDDVRLGPLKDLNGYFPFAVPATREAWERRATELRRRIRVASGIWPEPPRTPLEAKIWGRVERDGFTVEKVLFQSLPGHFVTGLLFRPAGEAKPRSRPGVLCPHGHGGRLQDHGASIEQLIQGGQERFERSGRFPKLARCAQLARMGCVAFIFDMLGYADSTQISLAVAHRLRDPRPGDDTPKSWRLFSAQAELRLQSVLGLQVWNNIRCLDFLESLADVDPSRLGVTGGSGGGTQTILLGAIDPRPVVAFPQGMVSTSMQGGCTCENTPLLRIESGNVELAALFAPKPQAMTAANDWTRAMMTEGYPTLRKVYALYDAQERVLCRDSRQFPHNYNYPTRRLMYGWFNRHLGLGLPEPIVEQDWDLLSAEESRVWDGTHPEPESGESYERKLCKQLDAIAHSELQKSWPRDAASLASFREVVGGALAAIIGRRPPSAGEIERVQKSRLEGDDHVVFTDLLRLSSRREEIPLVSLYPRSGFRGEVVLWFHGDGKRALWGDDGVLRKEVRAQLAGGRAILSADLFLQGEFLEGDRGVTETRVVANPRVFACFTHTYNDSLFARRVHDVLTVAGFVGGDERAKCIDVIGESGAGPVVALASALLGDRIRKRHVDTTAFRFERLRSFRDPDFLPGAVKYGDLPAFLALSAPHPLTLFGERGVVPEIVRAAYEIAGAGANARVVSYREQLFPQAGGEH